MDGLILLVILIPLVFLILLITLLSRSSQQKELLELLNDKLKKLSNEITVLTKELQEKKIYPDQPVYKAPPVKTIVPESIQKEEIKPAEIIIEETIVTAVIIPPVTEKTPEPARTETISPNLSGPEKNNRDLEKFIGENLVNKIGIAILVLGIAFFVKYAIDKDRINESGRVVIGLLSGGILIGMAHYYRNTYRSFSSVLVGGGLSVLYFSIAFAFHQYHLIGQTPAFIYMVIISAGGVLLSLFYNRQELAILATIGGFVTPFLVSTGQENYVALFTYLGILNTGLMVLAWFKRWPAINTIALFFTTFIYAGWLIKRIVFEDPSPLPYRDALLFATLFYFLFVVMNIINTIRLKKRFTAFDFIILLSTNFLYYTAGMVILEHWNEGSYEGIFTAGLGMINGLLAFIFYNKKNTDRNFIALMIGLSLTFISLTAAIQFDANFVVLFWAAESVILYWLYRRSSMKLLRWASFMLVTLMIAGLLWNWAIVYFNEPVPVLINKGFITALAASVALFILYDRIRKTETSSIDNKYLGSVAGNRVQLAAILVAWLAGALEIIYQFNYFYPASAVYIIYLQAYSFAVAFILLQFFKRSVRFWELKSGLIIACYIFYLLALGTVFRVSNQLLMEKQGLLFSIHWISSGILVALLYGHASYYFREKPSGWASGQYLFTWIFSATIIFLFSIELYHIMLWLNYNDPGNWPWWRNLYNKAGLSILWSCCSFAMMWLGMKNNFRTLRIISLTLFTITLLKLFVYDIRNIPPGGKITAFILLGILLLAVSFMYQRLKKIIIDNKGL